MKQVFKAVLILFKYLVVGLLHLIALVIAFLVRDKDWLTNLDRSIASAIYGTQLRTLSGICGANAKLGKIGYVLAAKVIDLLARLFGDKPEHCNRVNRWEIIKGYNI